MRINHKERPIYFYNVFTILILVCEKATDIKHSMKMPVSYKELFNLAQDHKRVSSSGNRNGYINNVLKEKLAYHYSTTRDPSLPQISTRSV